MTLINVDREKCNKDGICIAECPAQVLRIDHGDEYPTTTPDFEEVCIECGHCVAVCPTGAFSLEWLSPEECPAIRKELMLSPEQAEQFLRSRRSIRVFKDKPVERAKLEKLIEVGGGAPSAKNEQPWGWIVIENKADVDRLDGMMVDWMRSVIKADSATAETMRFPRIVGLFEQGLYRILRNAPHLILVHVDEAWAYGKEDTALALGYIELLAPALGLGATWSGYFIRAYNTYPPLAQAVPVPEGRKIVGALMVGRPTYKYHRIPKRRPPAVDWR